MINAMCMSIPNPFFHFQNSDLLLMLLTVIVIFLTVFLPSSLPSFIPSPLFSPLQTLLNCGCYDVKMITAISVCHIHFLFHFSDVNTCHCCNFFLNFVLSSSLPFCPFLSLFCFKSIIFTIAMFAHLILLGAYILKIFWQNDIFIDRSWVTGNLQTFSNILTCKLL